MVEMKKVSNGNVDRRWLRGGAVLAGLLLVTALPAFSQGCALCYTQAAAAGARMIAALRSGIIILVVPPTLASVGMIFVLRHKHGQVRRDEVSEGPAQDW